MTSVRPIDIAVPQGPQGVGLQASAALRFRGPWPEWPAAPGNVAVAVAEDFDAAVAPGNAAVAVDEDFDAGAALGTVAAAEDFDVAAAPESVAAAVAEDSDAAGAAAAEGCDAVAALSFACEPSTTTKDPVT